MEMSKNIYMENWINMEVGVYVGFPNNPFFGGTQRSFIFFGVVTFITL